MLPETAGCAGDAFRAELSTRIISLRTAETDAGTTATVDRILALDTVYPAPKHAFRGSPLYNAGVEAEATKAAAALLTDRIFAMFATVARQQLPPGTPLRISGGCELNCDWNAAWTELGHFSSVFMPPCTNDSGSAIGTAGRCPGRAHRRSTHRLGRLQRP